MTRVLHVLDHSLPLHSGYTFRTRAILKSQQAMGIEVRGITGLRHMAAGPDEEEADGILFHRTRGQANGPAGLREWREIGLLAVAIVKLCGEWRPDVIHAHSPALCGAAALRASRRLGIPLVYEIRAFWEDAAVGNGTGREGSAKYWLTRLLENDVVSSADKVVTICEGLRADLIGRGYPPEKISIMPNGVDLDLFGDPLPRDAGLGQELGLGDGTVIGFLGSFYPYEGLDDLIAAMTSIVERVPDARLLMVGGGPADMALRAQAAASAAAHAIHFVGRVPHTQVERYYSLVDVVCYPRKAMRLTDLVTPLKPLEAMAQGKLVAASDVGGHRELVRNGVNGTLFPADSPAGLADAMVQMLETSTEWPERRERARTWVGEHHDWASNVRRYELVYQALLPHRKVSVRAA
ncbi:MAG: TIGR04063 family PEP-CTERM/XrtA system glycosyltransferase [Novosphingobium sp.]